MRLMLGLFRWLVGALLRPFSALMTRVKRRRTRGAPRWLLLPLEGRLSDLPPPSAPYFGVIRREKPLILIEIDEVLEAASRDPDIAGVICRLGELDAGWAGLWELREALRRFQSSGKQVKFYFDQASSRGYWLASCADEVLAAPQGTLNLLGLRAEVTFFRRLFDLAGVVPDFLRVGRYKSFAETFTEDEMTPAMNESLSAVLDDLSLLLVEGIASGRGLPGARVRELIDQGPFTTGEAVGQGLIDAVCYPDELKERLEVGEQKPVFLSFGRYARRLFRQKWLNAPLRSRPQLAVVSAEGSIVDRAQGGLRRGGESIECRAYVRLLNALREDPQVKGVVLRINSPGGSALASDLLWRAVSRLQKEKPVVVSMGDTAASGGFYMAAPAGRIFATPGTLTGSIGVVGGKFSIGPLYERLGIHKQAIERGRHSGIHASDRPFSETERVRLQQAMDSHYRAFVDKVAEGRSLEPEQADAAAHGRVWSGRLGREIGLVDTLGGLREAIEALRAEVKAPRGLETVLLAPRAGFGLSQLWASAVMPAGLKELVLLVEKWSALAGSRGEMLTLLPYEIDIR